jgi:glycerol uptake facilitator-like aquaporin
MPALPQRAFCEWLGTAFLLAAVVGSGIMAQKLAGGNDALALLCNTLPTGAILAVLILVFGPLSGAHFNPAVSLAFALRGELAWSMAVVYIAAQVFGASSACGRRTSCSNCRYGSSRSRSARVQDNGSRKLSRPLACC